MKIQGRDVKFNEDGTPSNSESLFFFLKTAIVVVITIAMAIVFLTTNN